MAGGHTASYDFNIGIIGGGSAVLTVAAGGAQLGAKTLLIDKDGSSADRQDHDDTE
jgi:pyruvate/2-oxoglutarate dehydrogenase complex dihydrolipoamide dehydrogenase (E3) component